MATGSKIAKPSRPEVIARSVVSTARPPHRADVVRSPTTRGGRLRAARTYEGPARCSSCLKASKRPDLRRDVRGGRADNEQTTLPFHAYGVLGMAARRVARTAGVRAVLLAALRLGPHARDDLKLPRRRRARRTTPCSAHGMSPRGKNGITWWGDRQRGKRRRARGHTGRAPPAPARSSRAASAAAECRIGVKRERSRWGWRSTSVEVGCPW